jgi:WD40 repeat protein
MDVHRAARIGDVGHGGQILLSQTTRDLVIHDLPQGLALRDLGEHRLKDLKYPTPIYQLVVEGLPSEFPALKTKFTGNETPTPGEPPFKGLEYFDEDDAELFFGREMLTARLVERLSDTRFLSVIIGASGSGKSSLVRAGLIPALKRGATLVNGIEPPEGSQDWQVHVITPSAHPLEALASGLTRTSESVTATATLLDDLARDPRSLSLFLSRQGGYFFLLVDQFEELFTLCHDEFEREAFIDNLLTALTPTPFPLGEGPRRAGEGQISLIITLRADFYAHLAQYPELRDLVAKQQEYIGPMTTEELRRAIEEPARRGHWEFEAGLVDLILRDVGDEPGALPLLSHALLETWKRRAGHTLTLKGYSDAGGVHGAIAHTAESVYQNLLPQEQTIARNIFVRLTELGEGTEDTRRRASFRELASTANDAEQVRHVLNILAEARLVTLSEATAEVAHEALIREWPTLREWLNEDREGLRLHRHITETAYDWELLGHDPGALYRGAHLAQANEWFASNPQALNAQERLFLEESNLQARREEQEREEQRERELAAAKELAESQRQSASRLRIRNRIITSVGSIALILALLAGTFGVQSSRNAINAQNNAIAAQNNALTAQAAKNLALDEQAKTEVERLRAENEKALATSRELALAANSNLDVDPELSILLSLQALDVAHTSEAESALHSAVQATRIHVTLQPEGEVWRVEYSPDGKRLATTSGGGEEAVIKIWDVVTGEELLSFNVPDAGDLKFNSEGTRLAVVSAETAGIWDASTGEHLLTLSGHSGWIQTLALSPDETLLATASEDHTAKVWDLANGQEFLTLSGHNDIVSGVEFSPDGIHVATTGWDWTTKVWDLTSGKEVLTLPGMMLGNPYSLDGKQIGTTVRDEHVTIWDVTTAQELFSLSVPLGDSGQTFNADQTKVIRSGNDGSFMLWDVRTDQEVLSFPAHLTIIGDVALHPDGIHIATASADGTAKIWDISPQGSGEWLTLSGVTGPKPKVAYSPDGTRIAAPGPENAAIIWDAETGKQLVTMRGHTDTIHGIAFSPDGSRLATSSADLTVRVWDVGTGKELFKMTEMGHGDGVIGATFSGIMAVVFSPDGEQLASAGADGTTILWEAATGNPVQILTNLRTSTNVGVGFTNLAFSPDGTRLATGTENLASEEVATIWDLATGERVLDFVMPTRVWGLAFSPDGEKLVLAATGGSLKMWSAVTGEDLFSFSGHTATVGDIAFSPDGSQLASVSSDVTAKLWDASNGKELMTLGGHTNRVSGVAFSPDGARLATASNDGTARVYLLDLDELIAVAKSRLTRWLTTKECQKYLHREQCPSEP